MDFVRFHASREREKERKGEDRPWWKSSQQRANLFFLPPSPWWNRSERERETRHAQSLKRAVSINSARVDEIKRQKRRWAWERVVVGRSSPVIALETDDEFAIDRCATTTTIVAVRILHRWLTTPHLLARAKERKRERFLLKFVDRTDLHNSCKLVPTNACVAKIYELFRVVRSREEWVGFRWILNGTEEEGKEEEEKEKKSSFLRHQREKFDLSRHEGSEVWEKKNV